MFVRRFTKRCHKCGGQMLQDHTWDEFDSCTFVRYKEPIFETDAYFEFFIRECNKSIHNRLSIEGVHVDIMYSRFEQNCLPYRPGVKKLVFDNSTFRSLKKQITKSRRYQCYDLVCEKCRYYMSALLDKEKQPHKV